MGGLLLAELMRRTRRVPGIVVTVTAMAVVTCGLLLICLDMAPLSEQDRAWAEEQLTAEHADWERNHEAWEQECRDDGGSAAACAFPEPVLQDFLWEPLTYTESAGAARWLVATAIGFSAVITTSMVVGGEYASGSLAQWLTVAPRRRQVLFARLLAQAMPPALLAAVTLLLALLVLATMASALQQLPTNVLWHIGDLWRVGGVVALAAVWAGCLTTLFRHSAGGITPPLVAMVVLGSLAGSPLDLLRRWNPVHQLTALLDDGTIAEQYGFDDAAPLRTYSISAAEGWLYWGLLTAVMVAVTTVVFTRRDVR